MSNTFTVSELNRYVAGRLQEDDLLAYVSVQGEISGCKQYPSGHIYFSLKDKEAQVSCVAFRSAALTFGFVPENGMSVTVSARAGLYERDGRFQLVVNRMIKTGTGDLYAAYEKLKNEMQAKGYFDEAHKKQIPYLPMRIGVITSPKGAVISDIIHILNRRFPAFSLLLYPSAVQGKAAAAELTAGVQWFQQRKNVDVVIIARGGGSMEDLWCFNDEKLADAIYHLEIPVVSAVGHETDFTLCDFVSDVRAPTPSAAAELVMPVLSDILDGVKYAEERLSKAFTHICTNKKYTLHMLFEKLQRQSPQRKLENRIQRLDMLNVRMLHAIQHKTSQAAAVLNTNNARLDSLSPLKILSRGYGLITEPGNNSCITSISNVKEKQLIRVELADGSFTSKVESIDHKQKGGAGNA